MEAQPPYGSQEAGTRQSTLPVASENDWIDANPARLVRGRRISVTPEAALEPVEMDRIVEACRQVRLQGCTNDNLLAFVLVLRYSGLRIGDASMLTIDRFKTMSFSLHAEERNACLCTASAFRDELGPGDQASTRPVFVYRPGVRAHGDSERSLAAKTGPGVYSG